MEKGVVEHRLLWRVGGEMGFTCFPAHIWQHFHGGLLLLREPWLHMDTQLLLRQGLLFRCCSRVLPQVLTYMTCRHRL